MRQRALKQCLCLVFFSCVVFFTQRGNARRVSSSDKSSLATNALDNFPRQFPTHRKLLYGGEYHDVKILTDARRLSIASTLLEYFQHLGISAALVGAIDERHVSLNVLYIILQAAQYDIPFGLRYVVYQVESTQTSPWSHAKNRKMFADDSLFVFDFSVDNYQLLDLNLQKKTAYLPIPLTLSTQRSSGYEFDVLFYGSMCARRFQILDKLRNKHNIRIKVVSGVFGENMAELIKKARVVLNLHCYNSAPLETSRINEVLKYDKIIVSEDPVAEDKYSRALYKDVVIFTKNLDDEYDYRHVEELASTLRFYTDRVNYRKFVAARRPALASLKRHCLSRFKKALVSLQIFSPTSFYKRLHPDTIYFLSLDESWQTRRDVFLGQKHVPANIKRIPGIKVSPGWIGCGMSYKFAINSAKMSGLDQVTICEDDALFPSTFERDYRIIREYLSTLDKWDIFVGLIADFDNSTEIYNVENYKGLEFVTIDKFTSTVFNIYNASSFDHILSWDERNLNLLTNTVDRYLQSRNLTVVTTNPYFLKHMELGSTLWGNVTTYPEWFARSAKVFSKKVEDFRSKQGPRIAQSHAKMSDATNWGRVPRIEQGARIKNLRTHKAF